MKETWRKVLFVLLAAAFLCTGGLLVRQMLDTRSSAEANDLAQSLAGISTIPTGETTPSTEESIPESTPEASSEPATEPTKETEPPDAYAQGLLKWDAASLQEVNPEVIGWILLPGTQINYPLLHASDNETYLHTAWDGTFSVFGSIFLESKSNPDFTDFNTIVYGHHMRNGTMFAALMGYKEESFFEEHRNIYIATEEGVLRYTVFSAYEAPVVSDTYRLYFKDLLQMQAAIGYYLDSSLWEPPVTPTIRDQILTLSTCTGTGQYETRWVVQAVLSGSWANEKAGFPEKTSF